MKFKLILISLFVFILFSCKNENKENSSDLESSKSSNNLSENKKLLLDFYTKNDKKPQFFLIDNNKDTTIVCSEKTRITIKANSFVFSKTGKNLNNSIKISVKEYYTISDILLGRLSTTSNGNLLETGGMLEINATSDSKKCDLKKGKNIEIEIPTKAKKERMQLFTGNWKNNTINWNLEKNSIDLNQTFSTVDEMPVYPGGVTKMNQFISRNLVLPKNVDILLGTVYTSFIVDKEGNVTDIKITKGFSKNIDAEAIKVLKKLSKFTPGKLNGIPVNVLYPLPIDIGLAYEEDDVSFSKKTISKNNNEMLKKAGSEDISYYLFSSSKLGMINCDRFWDYDASLKINYAINLDNNSDAAINIVFHSFKSVLTKSTDNKNITFDSIPSGEKITIFAIKYFDKKPFLAIKETKTSAQGENNLDFQEITFEKLKNEMKKLNKLH